MVNKQSWSPLYPAGPDLHRMRAGTRIVPLPHGGYFGVTYRPLQNAWIRKGGALRRVVSQSRKLKVPSAFMLGSAGNVWEFRKSPKPYMALVWEDAGIAAAGGKLSQLLQSSPGLFGSAKRPPNQACRRGGSIALTVGRCAQRSPKP